MTNDLNALAQVLGEDNASALKKRLVDVLIQKAEDDLYKILGLTQEEILKEVEKNVGKEPEKEK